jgi:hypothetical protein
MAVAPMTIAMGSGGAVFQSMLSIAFKSLSNHGRFGCMSDGFDG